MTEAYYDEIHDVTNNLTVLEICETTSLKGVKREVVFHANSFLCPLRKPRRKDRYVSSNKYTKHLILVLNIMFQWKESKVSGEVTISRVGQKKWQHEVEHFVIAENIEVLQKTNESTNQPTQHPNNQTHTYNYGARFKGHRIFQWKCSTFDDHSWNNLRDKNKQSNIGLQA